MGKIGRLGLTLLAGLLFGSLPVTFPISDPNPAGVGFGEELFKLQGRVDYIYGHVLRGQKKLELQIGDLQKSMQNLDAGGEVSALRGDLLRLQDELGQLHATIKSRPGKDLSELQQKVNSLESTQKKQETLELKLAKLQESIQGMGPGADLATLKADLYKLRSEMGSVHSDMKSLSERVRLVVGDIASQERSDSTTRQGSRSGPAQKASVTKDKKELHLFKIQNEALPRAEKGEAGGNVLLKVYFPPGSSEINPQVASRIEALASESLKKNFQLSIVGFVSSSSPPAHEQQEAAMRAQVIYAKLLASGVDKKKVSSTISTSTEGWRDHKVEITRAD